MDKVTFDVLNGQVVGFVGMNGAGKSTTIRSCVGVLRSTSGKVLIDGIDLWSNKVEASYRVG